MARFKTFTNGGSILPGDINAIEDDYESAFSSYRDVTLVISRAVAPITIASTWMLLPGNTQFIVPGDTAAIAYGAVRLDPADYAASPRTTKYRLRAGCFVNAVAPAITFTLGLYPVATWGGASGAAPIVQTLGAVVSGSTVAFATPPVGESHATGADFTAPAAGWYVVAAALSGSAMTANSQAAFSVALQRRNV